MAREALTLAERWAGSYPASDWAVFIARFDSEESAATFREVVESRMGHPVAPKVLGAAHAAAVRSLDRRADLEAPGS